MADSKQPVKTTNAQSKQKKDYIFAVGRRRAAVARVRLYENVKADASWNKLPIKKGEILVNEKPIAEYFASDVMRFAYTAPFRITNTPNKFAVTIKVQGGGPHGQLEAAVLGMVNALVKLDAPEYRDLLKKKHLITRDDRIRERRKVGTGGKARRKKQSPKR